MTESVRARTAPTTPIRRLWFHETVLDSLWFVPLVTVVVALVVIRVVIELDGAWAPTMPRLLFPGGSSSLVTVSGTIAAGMLTILAVVFSTTLVAVQLASSQYSPRIVRAFVRSRSTHAALALFLATFVVAIEVLVAIDEGGEGAALAATLLYLLMLASAVAFVVFLHRIVRLLRVQYLLLWVSRSSVRVMDQELPTAAAYRPAPASEPDPTATTLEYVGHPGVIQAIDLGGLARRAQAAGAWVDVLVRVGEHVGRHSPLAVVHGGDGSLASADIVRHLLVGGERTLLQDPAFGIRVLVDTASRALSPAVNDPTTAVQALHRVADLLLRVIDRPEPTGWYTDDTGTVRLRVPVDDIERLVRLGLTEILRYGADDPQVTRALAAVYDDLVAVAPDRAPLIDDLRAQWSAAIDAACPAPFRDLARRPDHLGLG